MASSSDASNWIGDGSEGGKLDVAATDGGGATITFASSTRGAPFNVRLDADPPGNSFYEVKVTDLAEESSLGVGLVAAVGFRAGWCTSGCFYNGNVTDGSAGLVIGFGGRIKKGDVVGVRERRRSGDDGAARRDVTFYHNGRCLGAGFSLECDEDERLYPCLHLSGSAAVEYSVPSPPSSFEREEEARDSGDPYGGDWAVEQAFSGPELSELAIPEGKNPMIHFEGDGSCYRVSAKVSNTIGTSLTVTGKAEAFDEIQLGTCRSTRMRPRPGLGELEGFMGSALNGNGDDRFQKMIVTEEGRLIMSGPTAEVICSRHVETFEPVIASCAGGKIVVR